MANKTIRTGVEIDLIETVQEFAAYYGVSPLEYCRQNGFAVRNGMPGYSVSQESLIYEMTEIQCYIDGKRWDEYDCCWYELDEDGNEAECDPC